jgi:drug/metabolite transporter (DMT)-like permease
MSKSSTPLSQQHLGYIYGFIGVAIFALTLPFTRFAVHDFNPVFLAIGRTVAAAALAFPLLLITKQPRPTKHHALGLALTILGVVFGFPILSAIAMQSAPASHGGVVLGALPIVTAIMSVILAGERPSLAFWFWGALGSALVITFALSQGGPGLHAADGLLVLAVLSASMGYAAGGNLSRTLGGWQVICWALVFALPISLPLTMYLSAGITGHEPFSAWACFAYLAVFSQFIGFFAWNKGLALGGVAKVGQVQLLQSFMTLVASAALLGETVTLPTIGFALAVATCVWFGRKARVGVAAKS